MNITLARVLYAIAALAWLILLRPNPITIFLAAALACLAMPVYRRLRLRASKWRRSLYLAHIPGRRTRVLLRLSNWMPVTAYSLFLFAALFSPIAVVALLVSPQAVAGLARLRELRANNFQVPDSWLETFHSFRASLAEYPRFDKALEEAIANLDSLFTDVVGMLVSRSFGFVGSTMNVFWLAFLFFTLTILFTVHGRTLRKVAARIMGMPTPLLCRFLAAVHKALKGIILGIIFVALIQGFMCGIGFAVAGVNQPAFWGMLATMVAPIPVVGTALVWGPLCISLWFSGHGMAAIGLALWGVFFVAGVDNILRPFFLRQGIGASFFVLILSILCGLSVFGAVGLIAGPVLLAIAMQSMHEANSCYRTGR